MIGDTIQLGGPTSGGELWKSLLQLAVKNTDTNHKSYNLIKLLNKYNLRIMLTLAAIGGNSASHSRGTEGFILKLEGFLP